MRAPEPDRRRRRHAGPTKGERRKDLRRAVFSDGPGEVRDRSCENGATAPKRSRPVSLRVGRRGSRWRHERPGAEHGRGPCGPGTARVAQRAALLFDVVFDAADGGNFVVEEQIRGARIAVVRKAGASGVGNAHAGEMADVRTVDVGVDDDGRGERTIDGVESRVGGIGRGGAPRIAGCGVDQCHRTGGARDREATADALRPTLRGQLRPFPGRRLKLAGRLWTGRRILPARRAAKAFHPCCPLLPASRGRGFGRRCQRGLEPQLAKSPPWRMRSGDIRRKSARIASKAVRLP